MIEGHVWSDVSRVETWAGEVRVNLVRLIAIVLFYGRHLFMMFAGGDASPERGRHHLLVTAIALAWATLAIVLHIWLSRRHMPDWLKYAAVAWDASMMTLLCAATGGPMSPLVLLYFALIASAPLRLSLRLVYAATAAAMLGYLFLLGHYAFYVVGVDRYYATPELRVDRRTEAITLLALLVCGLFAGQVVRQIRRVVMLGSLVRVANDENKRAGDAGMNAIALACPRCHRRLTVSVNAPPRLTCPSCLAKIDKPPIPAMPPNAPIPLVPIEDEVNRDAIKGRVGTILLIGMMLGGILFTFRGMMRGDGSVLMLLGLVLGCSVGVAMVALAGQAAPPGSSIERAADLAGTILKWTSRIFAVVLLLIGVGFLILLSLCGAILMSMK